MSAHERQRSDVDRTQHSAALLQSGWVCKKGSRRREDQVAAKGGQLRDRLAVLGLDLAQRELR
eukprot:48451-Rhodomonas_salina.2